MRQDTRQGTRRDTWLITSAVAFALACLVMVTLHEAAHAVAGLLQGGSPTMYAYAVDTTGLDDGQQIVTALAGPLSSLVSGLVVLALPRASLGAFWRLAVLWLGLLSVQEVSGYLITGPFVRAGDIGAALELSGAPAVVGWIGVVGWAGTYLLGRHAVRCLAGMVVDDAPHGPQLRALGLLAWLLGTAIVVAASLGVFTAGEVGIGIVFFQAFGVLAAGIFLVFVRLFLPATGRARPADVPSGFPVAGLVVLVVVAVARQVVLADGLTL